MTFLKSGIGLPAPTIFRHPAGFLIVMFTVELQKSFYTFKPSHPVYEHPSKDCTVQGTFHPEGHTLRSPQGPFGGWSLAQSCLRWEQRRLVAAGCVQHQNRVSLPNPSGFVYPTVSHPELSHTSQKSLPAIRDKLSESSPFPQFYCIECNNSSNQVTHLHYHQ